MSVGTRYLQRLGILGGSKLLEHSLWNPHVPQQADDQQHDSGDRGGLAKTAHRRQLTLTAVHGKRPLAEEDAPMIEKHMPDGIQNEGSNRQRNDRKWAPPFERRDHVPRGGGHAGNIPDNCCEENSISTKREVVECLTVRVRFNRAAGCWKQRHQQQWPTSGTQDTGQRHHQGGDQHCPGHGGLYPLGGRGSILSAGAILFRVC